ELHTHDFYELFLIVSGSVDHLINDTCERLETGILVFIRPADRHAYGSEYGGETCTLVNLAFTEKVMSAVVTILGEDTPWDKLLNSALPPSATLSREGIQRFTRSLENFFFRPAKAQKPAPAGIRLFLAEAFLQFFSQPDELPTETVIPSWLSSLYESVAAKPLLAEGLKALYGLTDKTPEHICRMTKKYYCRTPTEKINEIRLSYAEHLLSHSDSDILSISLECGFNNLSHFYHLFKKHYTYAPSAYRQQVQRNVIPKIKLD
ncbi:MAG: AraC family transcriptional regulator, partial [Gorillibacterium sp.]|nr:AraC family transcriptional regulator [Gorillibacterium sp.]